MSDIFSVSSNRLNQDIASATSLSANNSGTFAGLSVEADNSSSALMDSVEEMSFAKDNFKQQKKLSDRKSKDVSVSVLERIEKALEIIGSRNELDDLNRKFSKIDKTLSQNKDFPLKQLIGESSGQSDAELYLYLKLQEKNASSEIKEKFALASEQVYERSESKIDAFLNALNSSDEQNIESANAYSHLCCELSGVDKMLDYLEKSFPQSDFSAVVKMMQASLVCDLQSIKPSHESTYLYAVGRNLTALAQLNSSLNLVNNYLQRVGVVVGDKVDIQSKDFIKRLINLSSEHFVNTRKVRDLYKEIPKQDITGEVLLSQELLSLEKKLDVNLFASLQERNQLVEVTQNLVDVLIDKEDEELAAQGN